MIKILLVDDDDGVRELTVFSLDDLGYKATEAANVSDAITKFDEQQNELNAAILDLNIIGGTALEIVAHIQAKDPYFPILIITGGTGIELGELPVLDKPFTFDALAEAVQRLLSAPGRPDLGAEPLPGPKS